MSQAKQPPHPQNPNEKPHSETQTTPTCATQALRQAVPDGLEEIQTLARTLISRSQDVLAYFDRPGRYLQRPHAKPSTDAWSTYAASPWDLRNLTNYTIRSLIHAGRLKDHLAATT